jgi:hypothetical protein
LKQAVSVVVSDKVIIIHHLHHIPTVVGKKKIIFTRLTSDAIPVISREAWRSVEGVVRYRSTLRRAGSE